MPIEPRNRLILCGLPASLALYAGVALQSRPTAAGLLDAASFVLVIAGLLALAGRLRGFSLRLLVCGSVALVLSALCIGNTHYYEAFHDWLRHDVLVQWRLGPSVTRGLLASLGAWDLLAGLGAPVVFAVLAARRRQPALDRLGGLALLLVLSATGAMHHALTRGGFDAAEQNVVMNFSREWLRDTLAGPSPAALEGVDVWDYFPQPAGSYVLGSRPDYPLLKLPKPVAADAAPARIDAAAPPNVVLILMESVRAFESGAYGAEPSFTPQLDRLAGEGLLFSDFYANGSQTVRAELALLCSFYPNLAGPPIYRIHTGLRLRSLPTILAERGYTTLWISGFKKNYANKFAFLSRHGIQKFFDDRDLPPETPRLGWGASDEAILAQAEAVLDRQDPPFFAEIMTLSNHWPFDWPYPTRDRTPAVGGEERYVGFTRGTYYTDWAVGRFIERVRDKPWFANTIFALVGDHGIWVFPEHERLATIQKQEAYFRVPFLLYAPSLIEPGVVDAVGSQVDFAPTLLHLLGIRSRNAFVGRSLLAPPGELERYALMTHVRQWNLRVGDRYVYDVGREFFEEHFPQPPPGTTFDPAARHVSLVTADDLLRLRDPDEIRFGEEADTARHVRWAETLVAITQKLMREDRVIDE